MKTILSLFLCVFCLSTYSQNTCNLKAKIKLVKPQVCAPCQEIYASTVRGSLTYQWNTGAVTDTISVCNITPALYIVTVTDTSGCSDVDSLTVSNHKKCENVCHRDKRRTWKTICIDSSAVAAHLIHGDSLGCCGSKQPSHIIHGHGHGRGRGNGHKMTVEFENYDIEKTVVTLTGIDGKQLLIYEGVTDGETIDVKGDFPNGIYILTMQTSGERITTKVVVLE